MFHFVKMFNIMLFIILINAIVAAVPKSDNLQHRVKDHAVVDDHILMDHHDKKFDHEAFLGEQEAKAFDELPPDESKRRLGIIVDKIDDDKDGFVTIVELKDWIRYTQKRYIAEDADRHWKQHNPNSEESISWETYKKNVYGFMDGMNQNELDDVTSEGFSYKAMLKRDRRRWHFADTDDNDQLNFTEFSAFLHPEENPTMREVILLETIEDIDKDKDGKISEDEYIGDMYNLGEDGDEEPEWVKTEREQFREYRDTNKDGFMDKEEVKSWIAPPEFDHAEAEARHLIVQADSDADEKLTKDEIVNQYDLFVGSQATDFGEALSRHDEF